jgi:hypothetical protein
MRQRVVGKEWVVCDAFYRVMGGEVRVQRRPAAVDFYPTVSTLNRGGESTRRRASAGEGRQPGGSSIQLRPSAGGQRTAACGAAASGRTGGGGSGGRWKTALGDGPNGPVRPNGLAKRFRAKNKDLNRWASDLIFELISRILSSNKIVLNIFKLNLNGVQTRINSNILLKIFQIWNFQKLI